MKSMLLQLVCKINTSNPESIPNLAACMHEELSMSQIPAWALYLVVLLTQYKDTQPESVHCIYHDDKVFPLNWKICSYPNVYVLEVMIT